MKIGAKIKKLRIENAVTQDTLATAIGVTPQAISRWEAEGGYPDITLLPAIADFFSVSIDELLGYKMSEREQRIAEIKKEMARLQEVGTIEESLAFARVAASKYPAECEIKENLAECLYWLYDKTKNESLLPEAESSALYAAENCKDEGVRYDAINTLVSIYAATKRTEKAHEMINRLTPLKYCREVAKSRGIGDGNNEVYKQDEIEKLADHLGLAIRNLTLDEELPNDPSTWEKKIEMLQTSNALYLLIFGDNLMFHHCRVAFNHWLISSFQMAQGKTEEALLSLEKMCQHTVAYDESFANDHGKYFTSILVDKIIYPEPGKEFHELTEHSQSWHMLDRLESNRYDAVRGETRFEAIVKKLKEYAK